MHAVFVMSAVVYVVCILRDLGGLRSRHRAETLGRSVMDKWFEMTMLSASMFGRHSSRSETKNEITCHACKAKTVLSLGQFSLSTLHF